MKNLKFFLLAMAGCCALACDSDDDSNNNSDVAGTYNLTAFNAPMSVDFDGNGTSSSNIMNESNCYANSKLVLNSDGSYTLTDNSVNISGTTSNCGSQTTTGTWSRSGNTFTMNSGVGTNIVTTNYNYVKASGTNGATMTRTTTNGMYPSLNASGNPQWSIGTTNMVYTRSSN